MPAFSVSSATQIGQQTVRVTYGFIPRASNPTDPTDARNPANYTFSGPYPIAIQSIKNTSADGYSVDIQTSSAIVPGTYTVTVANVVSVTYSLPLSSPFAATFTAKATTGILTGGVVPVTGEDSIRKHLPRNFKGPGWSALIGALANSDIVKRTNLTASFDAVFLASAVGKWLDKRAGDFGVIRPANTVMLDDLFRRLAIKITANKLSLDSLLEVLEIYYGSDQLRAFVQASTAEPYALAASMQLQMLGDPSNPNSVPVTITFQAADATTISAATAQEAAEAINRQLRLQGQKPYAISWNNASTGTNFLRIYSGTRGQRGSVQILGGQAQNVFGFPTQLALNTNGVAWTISAPSSATGVQRFTSSTQIYGVVQANNPRVGDYVNVYGTEFTVGNRGSFVVTNTNNGNGAQYFEITNTNGSAQTVTQATASSLLFYRPTINRLTSARTALAYQPSPGMINVRMPATTRIVARKPRTGSYLHDNTAITISTVSRTNAGLVTVATSTNHNLVAGQWVRVDGLTPNASTLGNFAGGGLNGIFKVNSIVNATTFTYLTPDILIPTTNLVLQSQSFATSPWISVGATFVGGIVAPDGSFTATKILENTSVGQHGFSQNIINAISGTIYTISVYAKAGERNNVSVHTVVGATAYYGVFDLTTGATTAVSVSTTASSTAVGGGWWRCSITYTAISTTTHQVNIFTSTPGTDSFAGVLNSGVYIWGTQAETGGSMSPYVPTLTVAVTQSLNQVATITAVNAGGTATPIKAVADALANGPYTLDPVTGLAVTGSNSTITQAIGVNQQFRVLPVTDATQFPDAPGYLVIGFGKSYAANLIPYLGRASSTSLLIDYTYVFQQAIPSGEKIVLLSQKTPYAPVSGSIGAFYATAGNAGLASMLKMVDYVAATGFLVSKEIVYPGDRGLGAEGQPTSGSQKLSDALYVWGSDSPDQDYSTARGN